MVRGQPELPPCPHLASVPPPTPPRPQACPGSLPGVDTLWMKQAQLPYLQKTKVRKALTQRPLSWSGAAESAKGFLG